MASIFAKPQKQAVEETPDEAEDRHSPAKPEEEGEDELDDEEEEEQEEKAAVKLYENCEGVHAEIRASIFTKNHKSVSVADKGWKEGEP